MPSDVQGGIPVRYTENQSRACDEYRHRECEGAFVMIDQDGHSRYRCACYCHTTQNEWANR